VQTADGKTLYEGMHVKTGPGIANPATGTVAAISGTGGVLVSLDGDSTPHYFMPSDLLDADTSGQALLHDVETIFGLDVGALQDQFNTLKQVPVSVANILVKNGTDAINHAISVANSKHSIITGDFPGGSDRAIALGKMQWHANNLLSFTDPNAMYPSGDDLKKSVLSAYMESNAADEGAAWIENSWNQMWSDVKAAIAALPQEAKAAVTATSSYVGDLVHSAASSLVESATGVPIWAWAVGGAAILGIAGFAAYKILAGPTGGAIVGAYTGRRR
jgi:hypothetical protein